jgi:hypothetical protein
MHKSKILTVAVLVLAAVALVVIPSSAQSLVNLSGVFNYYTYAVKGDEILQDWDNAATAKLNYLDGQAIELVVTEDTIYGPRPTAFQGKLTPGGQIKLYFPDPAMVLPDGTELSIIDIVEGHTGCTVLGGTFPTFHGYMDGERLYASAHFNSRCDQEWPDNDVFDVPVEGPVQWAWTIDLTVDP